MQGEKGTLVTVDLLDLFDSSEFVEAFFKGAGPLIRRQSPEFKAEMGQVG